MKTPKIIIVGEEAASKLQKPIEFVQVLLSNGTIDGVYSDKPTDYHYIELIARNYGDFNGKSFDLIFCYDNPSARYDGTLYLGHWNDGVAE